VQPCRRCTHSWLVACETAPEMSGRTRKTVTRILGRPGLEAKVAGAEYDARGAPPDFPSRGRGHPKIGHSAARTGTSTSFPTPRPTADGETRIP
jgi:hypothetical protein